MCACTTGQAWHRQMCGTARHVQHCWTNTALPDTCSITRRAWRGWTCAAAPDERGTTGAWPHLVVLPESSLAHAGLAEQPWSLVLGQETPEGLAHLPQLGTPAKGCPRLEPQAWGAAPVLAHAGEKLMRVQEEALLVSRGGQGSQLCVHLPPSEATPSYLTLAELWSWAAALRSRASMAPPSRCTCTSCGSLSTLCISSWCHPMPAAASCGERVGRASPVPAQDGHPKLLPKGHGQGTALQPGVAGAGKFAPSFGKQG